jgi:hypothetical protein
MLTGDDRESLVWLRTHWDGHYVIGLADGVWRAGRVSNPAVVLTADTARDLRDMLKDDYAGQVSQRPPGTHGEGGSL